MKPLLRTVAAPALLLLLCTGCASNNTAYNARANANFNGDEANRPPRLLHSEPPIFPPGPRTRDRPWQLEIDVEFTVDPTGAVRDPRVTRSTDSFYDPLALECVRKWRFEPALHDGKPVAARLRAPFRFDLDLSRPAP